MPTRERDRAQVRLPRLGRLGAELLAANAAGEKLRNFVTKHHALSATNLATEGGLYLAWAIVTCTAHSHERRFSRARANMTLIKKHIKWQCATAV